MHLFCSFPLFFWREKQRKKNPLLLFIAKGENNQKRRRDNVIISGSRKKATVVLPEKRTSENNNRKKREDSLGLPFSSLIIERGNSKKAYGMQCTSSTKNGFSLVHAKNGSKIHPIYWVFHFALFPKQSKQLQKLLPKKFCGPQKYFLSNPIPSMSLHVSHWLIFVLNERQDFFMPPCQLSNHFLGFALSSSSSHPPTFFQ